MFAGGEVVSEKLKLNLLCIRRGEAPGAMQTYYTVGRKPAGGIVARVIVPEDLTLTKGDTLVLDFTNEPHP